MYRGYWSTRGATDFTAAEVSFGSFIAHQSLRKADIERRVGELAGGWPGHGGGWARVVGTVARDRGVNERAIASREGTSRFCTFLSPFPRGKMLEITKKGCACAEKKAESF
jgi:hypothetical protein